MYYLNHSNRPVRTRMPGGVGGAQLIMAAPYPDCVCAGGKSGLTSQAVRAPRVSNASFAERNTLPCSVCHKGARSRLS